MKISIVSTVFNRRPQFINVLKSISLTQYKNFEYIAVDDASRIEHKIDDLPLKYPFLKVINVNQNEKWWHNPCMGYNKAFKECTGDVILILGSECIPTSDILSFISQNSNSNNYDIYSCYSTDKETAEKLNVDYSSYEDIKNALGEMKQSIVESDLVCGWYVHPIYRRAEFHFMSSIYKEKLDIFGGFDEEFAKGDSFDDNDFIMSIKNIAKLNVNILSDPYCVHQYHEKHNPSSRPGIVELAEMNRNIFRKKWHREP